MARLTKYGQYAHRDTLIANATIKLGGEDYLATIQVLPSTPVIVTVTTTDANWTALATGLSGVLRWKIMELNGDNIHYAYVAAPGDNFAVAFGWCGDNTDLQNIYIKRPATANITVKLEIWTI